MRVCREDPVWLIGHRYFRPTATRPAELRTLSFLVPSVCRFREDVFRPHIFVRGLWQNADKTCADCPLHCDAPLDPRIVDDWTRVLHSPFPYGRPNYKGFLTPPPRRPTRHARRPQTRCVPRPFFPNSASPTLQNGHFNWGSERPPTLRLAHSAPVVSLLPHPSLIKTPLNLISHRPM